MSAARTMPAAQADPMATVQIGIAAALVAAADFLLFDRPAGLSLLIFAALLAAAIVIVAPSKDANRRPLALAAMPILALLPLAETVSALSVAVAVAGLAMFALAISGRLAATPAAVAGQIAGFLAIAPFRAIFDLARARRGGGGDSGVWAALAAWIVPVALGLVFLALFAMANPVIDAWLEAIDLWVLVDLLSFARILFWTIVAAGVWAFLRPRLPTVPWGATAANPPAPSTATSGPRSAVFGRTALLRSLVLFNLMFAVQTAMDAAYLWGGVALPEGLTYAGYAHRGAYPLIVTALLAAVFVLAAMRPGSETSADRLVRALVYAWIAQNVALVISSILRLDLYVGAYSLTHWRVAAFVWMGLVATGLALIMARIALGKSNAWLLGANLLTLSAVLYACSFINFAAMIAHFNVSHSREMGGEGIALDIAYLDCLGPQAIPALDRLIERPSLTQGVYGPALAIRNRAAAAFLREQQDWRAWSLRGWRLMRHLDEQAHGLAPLPGDRR